MASDLARLRKKEKKTKEDLDKADIATRKAKRRAITYSAAAEVLQGGPFLIEVKKSGVLVVDTKVPIEAPLTKERMDAVRELLSEVLELTADEDV